MLEVLKKYPIVCSQFFEWIFLNHRGTEEGYANATEYRQALALITWLGYSKEVPAGGKKSVTDYLDKILTDYQQALLKHPQRKWGDRLPIETMTQAERMEKFPELFTKQGHATILPSIRDAFNFSKIPQHVQKSILEEEDKEFWEKVNREEAPF